MKPSLRDFWLPEGAEQIAISDSISSALRCVAEAETETLSRYLDSFDWALYQAGAALQEETVGERRELVWLDLNKRGAIVARQPLEDTPGFIDAMPLGPVRDLLEPLLGIRRLLPMASVSVRARTLRVLNEDDKTVARIRIEENWLIADGARPGLALRGRLRLSPVRGYARELDDAAQRLERALNLTPADEPVFSAAVAAAGLTPGAYSTSLSYRLDPRQRADAAAKEILQDLLDTLEANVDGTRRNLDSEFLHDLRVATRRTRSALSQIKGVFPEPIVDDFKARFAWLQQVTGPMRDLDVYLLDYPGLRDSLPRAMRDDLEPLRDWLGSHYAEEQSRLVEALDSPQFENLMREWRAFLQAPVPVTSTPGDPENAGRSIKTVADRRIRSMFKRLLREGRAITDASPAEELHELRKTCKKLRYLMEFFQSLYPPADIRRLIKQSKVLLDNLGGFQDLEVQALHLAETAKRMHADGSGGAGTLLSMGVLINTLIDSQHRARADFAQTFAGFDTDANRTAFEALFGARKDAPREGDPPVAPPVEAGADPAADVEPDASAARGRPSAETGTGVRA